jgi:hypothetical protein
MTSHLQQAQKTVSLVIPKRKSNPVLESIEQEERTKPKEIAGQLNSYAAEIAHERAMEEIADEEDEDYEPGDGDESDEDYEKDGFVVDDDEATDSDYEPEEENFEVQKAIPPKEHGVEHEKKLQELHNEMTSLREEMKWLIEQKKGKAKKIVENPKAGESSNSNQVQAGENVQVNAQPNTQNSN